MSGFFVMTHGAVNTAAIFEDCDTPGCTATQSVLVHEGAGLLYLKQTERKNGKQKNSYPFEKLTNTVPHPVAAEKIVNT